MNYVLDMYRANPAFTASTYCVFLLFFSLFFSFLLFCSVLLTHRSICSRLLIQIPREFSWINKRLHMFTLFSDIVLYLFENWQIRSEFNWSNLRRYVSMAIFDHGFGFKIKSFSMSLDASRLCFFCFCFILKYSGHLMIW